MQVARRTLMPESLRAKIRSRWTMKDRPVLSEASIERLHALLDPDMRQLGAWLGRDLTCASYRDVVMLGDAPEWATKEPA
jgi:predicted transcriptional regulator